MSLSPTFGCVLADNQFQESGGTYHTDGSVHSETHIVMTGCFVSKVLLRQGIRFWWLVPQDCCDSVLVLLGE